MKTPTRVQEVQLQLAENADEANTLRLWQPAVEFGVVIADHRGLQKTSKSNRERKGACCNLNQTH